MSSTVVIPNAISYISHIYSYRRANCTEVYTSLQHTTGVR